ncbi:MAG: site-specific DNA-methyltransferase [Lactobacillaceae bacterium]|jgi:site-specific DNA-methyltransferase (adenine-specific)|nr:site-specific DNA-methyltransferase [Lactobacillaceae bacterium]
MKRQINNKFPQELLNTITLGDTIESLKKLPDSSVDMLFADPPYNMQVEGTLKRTNGSNFKGVEGNDWDEFESLTSYKEFTRTWLKEAQRVLKKDKSSLWVIGSFQNIYVVGDVLQELGFWIINDIVWSKTNPTPNFLGTKFTNRQETLLWATPTKNTKYQFNYKTMKELNGGKQMTSVWDIPVSSGNERVKDDGGEKLHPTQKPDKLLYNVIISSTKINDLIVDPFMGSGTTGAIAKRVGRNFYGIERDEKYHKYAMIRVNKEIPQLDEFTQAKFDIKPPKVKFHDLVDSNYINQQEKLYFRTSDITATISNVKELYFDGDDYGISKLGGILSGSSVNANGWDVWFVIRDNKKVPISQIRDAYRINVLGFEG